MWEPDELREASPERFALRELVAVRAALAGLERQLVAEARRAGWSWSAIASDLSVRRQTAFARYGKDEPRAGAGASGPTDGG